MNDSCNKKLNIRGIEESFLLVDTISLGNLLVKKSQETWNLAKQPLEFSPLIAWLYLGNQF
jgi:hypothetical protein